METASCIAALRCATHGTSDPELLKRQAQGRRADVGKVSAKRARGGRWKRRDGTRAQRLGVGADVPDNLCSAEAKLNFAQSCGFCHSNPQNKQVPKEDGVQHRNAVHPTVSSHGTASRFSRNALTSNNLSVYARDALQKMRSSHPTLTHGLKIHQGCHPTYYNSCCFSTQQRARFHGAR